MLALPRRASYAVPAALLILFAGCDDPAKDKARATVASAAEPMKAAPAAVSATMETVPADMAASSIGFTGAKVTGHHDGKFEKFSGSITLAGGKPEGGKVVFEVETSSVKTDQEKLDGHLKSDDFFGVGKFPKATFTSTAIKAGGEKGASHTVTGDLDLHGVRKTISFPATIAVTSEAVTGASEFVINRKDFGIVYPGKVDDLIRDDVVIKLSLKAPRKKG